jgi:molecular chaperone GrpE
MSFARRFINGIFGKHMSDNASSPPPHDGQPSASAEPAFDADPLTVAQAELAVLQAKSAELADQYLRAKADAENARRRAEDEITKARKFAVESFAESLLPVADSLEAGLAIKDATAAQINEGAQATLRQLIAALERNKVIAINPEAGAKFDPHHHQAISVVPAEQEANTVVTVLQKGYLIADRVLRPALVTVAAPK